MTTFHEIPINDIVIGERFRKDYGKIQEFADSIKSRGFLLEPIVVDHGNNLLAGGRRLAACKLLGWTDIPCNFIEEVDELTAREIELEENILRLELSWQEKAKLTLEIDRLYKIKYGQARSGCPLGFSPLTGQNTIVDPQLRQGGWSTTQHTADLRGVSRETVRTDIHLAHALQALPELENEDSYVNARRKVNRLIEDIERELVLRQRNSQVQLLTSSVLQGDATSLILSLETDSVDCIITDPPYGDDNLPFGQPHRTEKEFDDSPESTLATLRSLCPELRRVLKPSGHLYAFFGPKLWQQSIDIWRNAGFDVRTVICIWHKTGGATGTVNWDKDFAPVWEPFLFAHNGERRLAHKRDNLFAYPPDRGPERVHANQKPVALIRELIELSTDPNDLILDPFGGSGATALAAQECDRRFITFELSERFAGIIKERLTNATTGKDVITQPLVAETGSAQNLDDDEGEIFTPSDS